MMRWVKEECAANVVTIYGSSSDTKPTSGISNGSVFIETDTLDVYMFDEAATTWRKM